MKHSQHYIHSHTQQQIFCQCWLPTQPIIGVVLLVHGLGEHSSRYNNLVQQLVPQGYAVYSWDHLGHGRSEGYRKHIQRFTDFTQVLTDYRHTIQQQHPSLPLYLFGHSMGGLIAAHYLVQHQQAFRGAILSAPALKVIGGVPLLKYYGGKLLSALMPKVGMESVDADYISRDPKVLDEAKNDPLIDQRKATVRLLAELLDAMAYVEQQAQCIELPLLVLQGTEDRLVDPEGAERLYQSISSQDKTLKVYPGLYHELINEPEKAEVLRDISDWLAHR